MSTGTWYRIESCFIQGTGIGTVEAYLYDNSGNQLDHVITTAGTITGATTAYGGTTSAVTCTFYMDNLAVSDQGWIGSTTSFTLAKNSTAEGGTPGTTLTAANSGGGSGDAVDAIAGTLTFDNTNVHNGLLSYKTATASSYGRWLVPGTDATVNLRAYIYFTSLAATQSAPLYVYGDAAAHTASVAYLPANSHWQVALSGATTVQGTTTPVTGNWYRLEMALTCGAATAQVTARIYSLSGVLLETITSAANGTLTVPQYAEWGQIAAFTPSYWLDNLAVGDQGWIGGDASVPGVVAASSSAASAGTVSAAVTVNAVSQAVAASASATPAGTVTGSATVTGTVAASVSQAPAGTVTGSATVSGTVAASTSSAPAGFTSITVPGAVAVSASTAPPGLITAAVIIPGAVAASTSLAPGGTVTWSQNLTGTVAASTSLAPAGTVIWSQTVTGATARSTSHALAGKVICVQKPITLTVGTATSTWTTGRGRSG